ncbi:MAG: FAD-dependent oxidoreductase [Dehalococcoidales bacterium]|jgi:NAD(P)H-nitrite reductase large subunit|nr:FAD-dependent oxidoreductase [Dehalococcoidales bacterium]MDP7525336.1 FAD-dependent oxidoreductase [Dehalococcoidales bacterium]
MTKAKQVQYLIIGNSAGGIGAVEAIREVDKAGAITIISDEPHSAYSRPLIAEYLAEGRPLESMLYRRADFYEKNEIQTLLGSRVERLDLSEQAVVMESGERVEWHKLLLATGGTPIVPPMEGGDLKGVFTFTVLDDAKGIDQFLSGFEKMTPRALVIGGGLIGVSATQALEERGVAVCIVEMRDRVLNMILDEEASALEEEALKKAGVEIITDHTVAKIVGDSDGAVAEAILDDGRSVPCELVIVAIGVRPRTELVTGTEIEVNRGIVVDLQMATSVPDVYACGDVAEAYDFVYGENRLSPIWPNAYVGGRIAGFNMAGHPCDYPGGTAMNSSNYFGVDIVSAGLVMPPDDTYEVLSNQCDEYYRKVLLKDGLVVGLVFAGDIEKSGIIYNLMKDKVQVETFKQSLVADDFGLISLPEEIWRSHLEMPPAVD